MSVYIKGMEMPTNCFDCPCYHHKADDGYYDYEICSASGTIFNDGYASVTGHKNHIDPFVARLDNCPLVPVPEHGALNDRVDAFPIVFFSDRLEIERAFNEWAEENGVAKVPNALVAFLEINGLLNKEKTVVWCRARRQKKQTEEGE